MKFSLIKKKQIRIDLYINVLYNNCGVTNTPPLLPLFVNCTRKKAPTLVGVFLYADGSAFDIKLCYVKINYALKIFE
jgi:hypothetical protein